MKVLYVIIAIIMAIISIIFMYLEDAFGYISSFAIRESLRCGHKLGWLDDERRDILKSLNKKL